MLRWSPHWMVIDEFLSFEEMSSPPTTSPSNQCRLYAKDVGGVSTLCYRRDNGTEVCLTGGATIDGSGAANRLAYWTDADTLAAVAAITASHILFADVNGLPTGEADLRWDGDKLLIGGANNTELLRITATNQILSIKEVTADSSAYLTIGTNNQTNARFICPESCVIHVDAANDSTNRSFAVVKDTATSAGEVVLFVVRENFSVLSGGTAALATTATDGFLYVPSCAGTPTGTPTTEGSRVPIVVDTTNNKLYFYSGGAWRDAGP